MREKGKLIAIISLLRVVAGILDGNPNRKELNRAYWLVTKALNHVVDIQRLKPLNG